MTTKTRKFEAVSDIDVYTEVLDVFSKKVDNPTANHFVIPKGTVLFYNNSPEIFIPKLPEVLREIKQRRSRIKDTRGRFEKLLCKYSQLFFGIKIKFEKVENGEKKTNTSGRDSSLRLDFENKEENGVSFGNSGEQTI